MKLLRSAALVLITLGAFSASALEPASDRIVVMISVDGLAHFYFDDAKAEMPTIRQLAAEGARAEKMKASMPTVTWPNHTTLVTGVNPGKHGVIGNSYLDRTKGTVIPLLPDPLFNKEEIVKSPTIYDVAKAGGLKTAGIIWPASRGAQTLDWTVPDVGTDALFQKYGTASLLAEFKQAGIPYEKQEEWWKGGKGQDRDRMYTQMLNFVIETHRPNFALLHLVEVDHVEHAHGPQSPEAYEAVEFADERVKEVWEELKKDFPGKATLVVVSDHGFNPYQQQIQPNVVLRKEGLLTAEGTKITGGKARAVGQGGATFIYLLDDAQRAEQTKTLAEKFAQTEGVELVLTPKDYAKYGLPDPKENQQMADLVLGAKSGYSFSDSLGGDFVITPKTDEIKGTHGYDPAQDTLHATFVAWGAGIKAGAKVGTITNLDVAPTLAELLGLKMPNPDGQVLTGVLKN